MRRGFTLIELLVAIAVLGLIMLITVPTVADVINNSKLKVYEETKNTIEKAAQLYRIRNSSLFPSTTGGRYSVDIQTLKDNGLINENIVDPRTKDPIIEGEVIVELLSNGEYDYSYYPTNYVTSGLVLWYDAILHGDNINIWQDRSGNNANGTLTNFLHNQTSGWNGNHILFASTAETITVPNPLVGQTTSDQAYTVLIVAKINAYHTNSPRITGINSGLYPLWGATNKSLHYINSGVNDYYTYSKSVMPLSNGIQMAYRFYKNTSLNQMKVDFLINGVDEAANNFAANQSKTPLGMNATMTISRMMNMNLYDIKIYNRTLSDDEIKQNLNVDRERFNF